MKGDQWDRVGALLEEALARPAEEREVFLEETCENEALREKVISLLALSEEAGGYFDRLAGAVPLALEELQEQTIEGPAPASDDDPLGLEGTEHGRYVIEEQLGGGGMGFVYKARDTELGRPVALKFLPPYLNSHREARERFVREARAAAGLDHPHIATVYEIGETEKGRRFIAMAYYEGETLREKIRRGLLAVEDAVGYAFQIAEGLAAAHAAGIVHRDIKPENVMITERGTVKVLDFGLAKAAAQTQLTQQGQRLGTASYMSPEQAQGEDIDTRTDLWALGIVLYEMLTGQPPFEGRRPISILRAILHDEPRPVQELRPEVSVTVARAIGDLLAKDPTERYDSAEALLKDLRSLREPPVSTVSVAGHASGSMHPDRRWILGGAFLLVALVSVLGWELWTSGFTGESPSPADGSVPRSVAVLPFEVSGSGTDTWRDGMVTVLSMGLDGAGGLRAIPDRTVFAAWEQLDSTRVTAGRNRALATARQISARYAVKGSAVVLGGELRLTADIYATDSGQRLGQARAAGSPGNVMALADELARGVLKILLERSEEALPSVEFESLTTRSLPALKAYLRGERRFRAGEYEAAFEDYEAAIETDTTFALAYDRLNQTRGWIAPGSEHGALRRAYRLSHRLPSRERRIVRARYLYRIRNRYAAARDSLRRLSETYPDDPAVWFELGEVLYHGHVPRGWSEAEKAFRRAVKLDSGVVPYHHHLVELAFSLHHDSTRAAERVSAHPAGHYKQGHKLMVDFVFGTARQRQEALERVAQVPSAATFNMNLHHPNDGALQEQMLQQLLRRKSRKRDWYAASLVGNSLERGQIEQGLTQFREAPLDATAKSCLPVMAQSLDLPVPDTVRRSRLEPAEIQEGAPAAQFVCAGLYLIEEGRSEELSRLFARMQSTGKGASDPTLSDGRRQRLINEVKGYRAWTLGNLERAAQLWGRSIRPSRWSSIGHEFSYWSAIWRGNLYRALGEPRRAEGWYLAAWPHPVAHEQLGRLYKQMNRPEEAAAAYQRFIEAWNGADEALQDRVRRARGRLRQLEAVELGRAPS